MWMKHIKQSTYQHTSMVVHASVAFATRFRCPAMADKDASKEAALTEEVYLGCESQIWVKLQIKALTTPRWILEDPWQSWKLFMADHWWYTRGWRMRNIRWFSFSGQQCTRRARSLRPRWFDSVQSQCSASRWQQAHGFLVKAPIYGGADLRPGTLDQYSS